MVPFGDVSIDSNQSFSEKPRFVKADSVPINNDVLGGTGHLYAKNKEKLPKRLKLKPLKVKVRKLKVLKLDRLKLGCQKDNS
jgi:hypothetical protein